MSTQRKSSMVLFFVFLLSLVVAPLSGQSRGEDYPDSFAEEVTGTTFEKTAESMGSLIRMIEVDGQIQLLDNWQKSDARAERDKEPDKELEAEIQRFIDRGMDREMAERFASGGGGHRNKGMLAAFMKVQSSLGSRGGSGGSPGNKTWDYRIRSDEFGGHTRKDERSVRLQFYDYENDIDFYINKKRKDIGFQFRFCSAFGMLELFQSKDEIRLIVIQAGSPTVVSADNFRELMEESPQENFRRGQPWFSVFIDVELDFPIESG